MRKDPNDSMPGWVWDPEKGVPKSQRKYTPLENLAGWIWAVGIIVGIIVAIVAVFVALMNWEG